MVLYAILILNIKEDLIMLVIKISSKYIPEDIRVIEKNGEEKKVIYNVQESDRAFEVDNIYFPYNDGTFEKETYYVIDVPQSSKGFVEKYLTPRYVGDEKERYWISDGYIPNSYGAVEDQGYESYNNNLTADFLIEAYNRGEFDKYEYIIGEALTHLMTTQRPAAGAWKKWGELFAITGKTATQYVQPEIVERFLGVLKTAPDLLAKTGKQLGEVEGLEDEIKVAQEMVEKEQQNIENTGTIFSIEFTEKVNDALQETIKQYGGFQMEYEDHGHFDIEVDGKMYHGKLGDTVYSEYYIDENEENNEDNNTNSKYPETHFYAFIWQGDDYYKKGYYGESESWRTGYFQVQLTQDTVQTLEELEKAGRIIHGVEEEYGVEIFEEHDNSEKTLLQQKEEKLASLEAESNTISEAEALIDQQKEGQNIGEE